MRVRYSILSVIVGLGGVALEAAPTRAGLIVGGDYAGANLTVATGDVLSGSFTNVGTFLIPSGVTAYVAAGVPLSITAANFTLAGILDASGAGYAGGLSEPNFTTGCPGNGVTTGNPGSGPGGGAGGVFGCNIHGSGGGGGGYGASGGASGQTLPDPLASSGGPSYGNPFDLIVDMGSGGGSGSQYNWPSGTSGAGGAGGGSVTLLGGTVLLTGAILADGAPGGPGSPPAGYPGTSAGGGGAGGGILLAGDLFLDGLLSVNGGAGGNGSTEIYGSGGGGGAAGRIKLFGTAVVGGSFVVSAAGGGAGSSLESAVAQATAGGEGSIYNATTPPTTVPEPSGLLLLGIGLAATGIALRRRLDPRGPTI